MSIQMLTYEDVADGPTSGQFTIKKRTVVPGLSHLPLKARNLLNAPTIATIAVRGREAWPHLSPVWFDWDDMSIYVNIARSRKKYQWLRENPASTLLVMDPLNTYAWMSLMVTATKWQHEFDTDGASVTIQIDRLWHRYTGNPGPYALRDPRGEERVLITLEVERVTLYGLGEA